MRTQRLLSQFHKIALFFLGLRVPLSSLSLGVVPAGVFGLTGFLLGLLMVFSFGWMGMAHLKI